MSSTNNFKIFDESSTNLLNISSYTSNNQRVRGFDTGEEIPSALFNSVLRQNSLLSYYLINYMLNYSDETIVIEHDMNGENLAAFIEDFFDNYFETKFNSSRITYNNIEANVSDGSILYAVDTMVEGYSAPYVNTSDTRKSILGFTPNVNDDMIPVAIKEEIYLLTNSSSSEIITPTQSGGFKNIWVDLAQADANITTHLEDNKYEIFLEVFESDNSIKLFNSFTIPLKHFGSLVIGQEQGSQDPNYSVRGTNYFAIKTPSGKLIYIGLSSENHTITFSGEDYFKGRYLVLGNIANDITDFSIRVALKERI